ncbi:MAG TPA: 16S rRNA pseudouridine(516) synthase [Limnobacter sp.]|nr:16S rRNA pseudouridine(516) synthase [Limnobacter sp.]
MKVHPSVKILQSQGLGSRKICEKIFWESDIYRNDVPLNPETDQINYGDRLEIDGLTLEVTRFKYLMLHKPAGFETSQKPSRHRSVYDLLPPHYRARGIQAAGRLDVDTTGLLILSDDGQFIHRLISGKTGIKHSIEKIYLVTTAEPLTERQREALLSGVQLDDEPEPVAASQVKVLDICSIAMGITTGKYHQVKRMLAAAGNHVTALHRKTVGPYALPDELPAGQFLELDPRLLGDYSAEPQSAAGTTGSLLLDQ